MEYFRKVKPLKEDGFYLSVTYMFGDADSFETNVKMFGTEEEMFTFYQKLHTLFLALEGKREYDDVNWNDLYAVFGVGEVEFEQQFWEWMPTDDGLFFGVPQNIAFSFVEDGKEYELGVI